MLLIHCENWRYIMQKQNSEKRVVIYCRESRDDYGENYERIETQRDLLVKYCKSHGYTNIVDIIMDDDKSGTDFSRFDDIRERARKKEIDVIVFKNSARLGRNQREALEFVEYLEEQGVEIIFEDEQYNEEMFGLYAWFNERRARDDSKNIRRNLRHKIEEGDLLVKAIYGYNKDGKHLVINEETAAIVQEIFELYSKCWGYQKIATYLNKKGIPTPSQSRNFTNAKQTANWKAQHIVRILDDRRYTGDYVGGHTEKLSFKSKKTRVKPEQEWTIIENHHEPIIDKETWDLVQKLRQTVRRTDTIGTANPLTGLVYCADCGAKMRNKRAIGKPLKSAPSKRGKLQDRYVCSTNANGYSSIEHICSDHGIGTDALRTLILETIRYASKSAIEDEDAFREKVMEERTSQRKESAKALETKLNRDKKRCAELDDLIQSLYESNFSGKISDKRFKMMSEKYEQEQAETLS